MCIRDSYTGEKDVTLRLETILRQAGFRVVVLRSSVPTEKREDWYERQLQAGVEVVVCHPKLVETGLDLLAFPTLYFYETGYSPVSYTHLDVYKRQKPRRRGS